MQKVIELKKLNADLKVLQEQLANATDKRDVYALEGQVNQVMQRRDALTQEILSQITSEATYLSTSLPESDPVVQKVLSRLPNIVAIADAGRLADEMMEVLEKLKGEDGTYYLNSETIKALNKYFVNDSPVWRTYMPYLSNIMSFHVGSTDRNAVESALINTLHASFNCLMAAATQCRIDINAAILKNLSELDEIPESFSQPIILLVNNKIDIRVSQNQKNIDSMLQEEKLITDEKIEPKKRGKK